MATRVILKDRPERPGTRRRWRIGKYFRIDCKMVIYTSSAPPSERLDGFSTASPGMREGEVDTQAEACVSPTAASGTLIGPVETGESSNTEAGRRHQRLGAN